GGAAGLTIGDVDLGGAAVGWVTVGADAAGGEACMGASVPAAVGWTEALGAAGATRWAAWARVACRAAWAAALWATGLWTAGDALAGDASRLADATGARVGEASCRTRAGAGAVRPSM